MSKLVTLNNLKTKADFLNKLKDKNLIVYEDVQGSKIFINYSNGEIKIKKQSLKREPLGDLELLMHKYYHKAYFFFKILDINIKRKMNPKHWFCFEYFPDETPANITYDKMPKNNLVLTGIVKGNKFSFDYEEIKQWAYIFNTDLIPVLFKGKLSDKQLNFISKFLSTSREDLEFVFETDIFCKFFYDILNPGYKSSFLMNDDTYNTNLEKIIIRVENKEISYQALNPFYSKIQGETNTNYGEVFSVIILSFMEFVMKKDIDNIAVIGASKEELYINLISSLFNQYYEEEKENIKKFDFQVPPFFLKDKYRVNLKMIKNLKTKEIVSSSKKLEYIFKTILKNFKEERKKSIGLIGGNLLINLNNVIEDIDHKVESDLSIASYNTLIRKGHIDKQEKSEVDYNLAYNRVRYNSDKVRITDPYDEPSKSYDKFKK